MAATKWKFNFLTLNVVIVMYYVLYCFYLYPHTPGADLGNKNSGIISRLKYAHIPRRARAFVRVHPHPLSIS